MDVAAPVACTTICMLVTHPPALWVVDSLTLPSHWSLHQMSQRLCKLAVSRSNCLIFFPSHGPPPAPLSVLHSMSQGLRDYFQQLSLLVLHVQFIGMSFLFDLSTIAQIFLPRSISRPWHRTRHYKALNEYLMNKWIPTNDTLVQATMVSGQDSCQSSLYGFY